MLGLPNKTTRLAKIVETAAQFLVTQRSAAGDLIDRGDNAIGFLGFSYGVMDAMCLHAGLGIRDTDEAFKCYLQRLVTRPEEVERAIRLIARISSDRTWRHSIGVGASAGLWFLYHRSARALPSQFSLRNMLEQAKTHGQAPQCG